MQSQVNGTILGQYGTIWENVQSLEFLCRFFGPLILCVSGFHTHNCLVFTNGKTLFRGTWVVLGSYQLQGKQNHVSSKRNSLLSASGGWPGRLFGDPFQGFW